MVFEAGKTVAPEFPGAVVAVVNLDSEVHVDSFDIFGEEGGAGAVSYCEELEEMIRLAMVDGSLVF